MNASDFHEQPSSTRPDPDVREAQPRNPRADGAEEMSQKLRELPKDVGVMLVAVGAAGMVLPGMMGGPAILAGGLVLWPKAFGRVESWFERTFPKAHREGMRQIGRYLDDLDRRYAYSNSNRGDEAMPMPLRPDEPPLDAEALRSETP